MGRDLTTNQCSSQASVLRLAEAGCSLDQPPPQLQLKKPSRKRTFPLQTHPHAQRTAVGLTKHFSTAYLMHYKRKIPPCSSVSASRRRLLPSLVPASARLLLLLASSQLQSFGQTSKSTNTPYAGAADRGVAPTTSLLRLCL